jgi:hypothetical protein
VEHRTPLILVATVYLPREQATALRGNRGGPPTVRPLNRRSVDRREAVANLVETPGRGRSTYVCLIEGWGQARLALVPPVW